MGENVKRTVRPELILSIITLVLVVGLIGFEVWKYYQPSWDGLAGKVQTSMNEYLDGDEQLSQRLTHVQSVTVMHAAENTFEGRLRSRRPGLLHVRCRSTSCMTGAG